ncbi:MAG: response regulator, partial [Alphaproteobacteria bacterium]|nr:response regulator [Alphaproteobacteria bacterium]
MASAASSSSSGSPLSFGLVAIVAAASISAALLLWALREPVFAAAFFAGIVAVGVPLLLVGRRDGGRIEAIAAPELDRALLRAALDGSSDAVAVTDLDGELMTCNSTWEEGAGAAGPLEL